MATPPGYIWRPSTLPHLRRVLLLEREHGKVLIGSIGPTRRGCWMNRDTGEEFDTKAAAQANVEKYIP